MISKGLQQFCCMWDNPFPTFNKSAADDFVNNHAKTLKTVKNIVAKGKIAIICTELIKGLSNLTAWHP